MGHGRPLAKHPRTHVVRVRMTPDEHKAVIAMAAQDGISVSHFIRACAVQVAVDHIEGDEWDADYMHRARLSLEESPGNKVRAGSRVDAHVSPCDPTPEEPLP